MLPNIPPRLIRTPYRPFHRTYQVPSLNGPDSHSNILSNVLSNILHARYGPDNLEVVDAVRIPAHLAAGKYVVQWRWDCEESAQIWLNCADVTVMH